MSNEIKGRTNIVRPLFSWEDSDLIGKPWFLDDKGRPNMRVGKDGNRRRIYAHRLVAIRVFGDVAERRTVHNINRNLLDCRRENVAPTPARIRPIFSTEDCDLLETTWYDNGAGYAKATGCVYAHRLVVARVVGRALVRGEVVDHLNHVKHDNRRENLRLTNQSGNCRNVRKTDIPKSSRYIGVSFLKHRGIWQAYIKGETGKIHLGSYRNEHEAAMAYNTAANAMGFLSHNTITTSHE